MHLASFHYKLRAKMQTAWAIFKDMHEDNVWWNWFMTHCRRGVHLDLSIHAITHRGTKIMSG